MSGRRQNSNRRAKVKSFLRVDVRRDDDSPLFVDGVGRESAVIRHTAAARIEQGEDCGDAKESEDQEDGFHDSLVLMVPVAETK